MTTSPHQLMWSHLASRETLTDKTVLLVPTIFTGFLGNSIKTVQRTRWCCQSPPGLLVKLHHHPLLSSQSCVHEVQVQLLLGDKRGGGSSQRSRNTAAAVREH